MAGEIASAFVRIRPNMTGFKTETESGVRSAFSGLARIVGVSFGAIEAFKFGKDIIGDAANVQKQVETIGAEFGKAGKQVTDFADGMGLHLGIASHLADQTGARFGILFKNLGIGQKEGAGMTVGLLKLAGSLAAIRGVDPATVLERLPLALAGNLRSLKQLGLAVDSGQIKLAAWKLGLISSVKDAITPAIKAQAIYALATANLGKFQAQAQAHANDLANVQRRLSAEWDHAKELLGTALLPAFTRLAVSFDKWFERMLKSGALQEHFNSAAHTTTQIVSTFATVVRTGFGAFQQATNLVGGTRRALELLFAALAVNKVRAIAQTITSTLIQRGIAIVGPEAARGASTVAVANASIEASYAKLTGAIESLVAVIAQIGGTATAAAAEVGVAMGAATTSVITWTAETGGALVAVRTEFAAVGAAAIETATVGEAAMGTLAVAAVGLGATIKAALISTGIGILVVAIGFAVIEIINHFSTVKRWLVEFGHWLSANAGKLFAIPVLGQVIYFVVEAVKYLGHLKATFKEVGGFLVLAFTHPIRAVEQGFQKLKDRVVDEFKAIVRTVGGLLAEIPSWLPGIGRFHQWGVKLQAWAAETGTSAGTSLGANFSHAVGGFLGSIEQVVHGAFKGVGAAFAAAGKKLKDGVVKDIPNIVPVRIQLELAQARTPGAKRKALTDELAALNQELSRHLSDSLRVQVENEKSSVLDQLAALSTTATAAVKKTGDDMAAAVRQSNQRVAASVSAAKSNLDTIGQRLATAVDKILEKFGPTDKIGKAQEAAAKKLRDLIAHGGDTPELERAAQQLSNLLQAKGSAAQTTGTGSVKDRIKRQFADLTDEFNKGGISLATFNKRVAALLARNHVNYKEAGKLLGVAFADGFKENLSALHEQAAAIQAVPKHLRVLGGGGGAADPRIIRPLEVIRSENAKIATRAERQRERQIKAAEKTAKATQKTADLVAQRDKVKVGMLPGHRSKVAKRLSAAGVKP